MKEEILDITKKLYHNHLTPETATNLLLDLFAVSGRSEQLKAFDELFDYAWNLAQHPEEHAKLNDIKERF